jgi:hypothetical protein
MGHEVLISPEWIEDVSWPDSRVNVDLDRQAIKDAPTYNSDVLIGRDAEVGIYSHYDRQGYWHDKRTRAVA